MSKEEGGALPADISEQSDNTDQSSPTATDPPAVFTQEDLDNLAARVHQVKKVKVLMDRIRALQEESQLFTPTPTSAAASSSDVTPPRTPTSRTPLPRCSSPRESSAPFLCLLEMKVAVDVSENEARKMWKTGVYLVNILGFKLIFVQVEGCTIEA